MRLFAGLPVPEGVREELLRAGKRVDVREGRWTAPENLHVTLYFLGEVAAEHAEHVKAALASLRGVRFGVDVPRLGSFVRGGVLFAEVEKTPALGRLQAQVADRLAGFAARPDENSPPLGEYHPHITLARTRERIRLHGPGLAEPIRFGAEELNLYHSQPGPEGSRYEVIARVALGAGAAEGESLPRPAQGAS